MPITEARRHELSRIIPVAEFDPQSSEPTDPTTLAAPLLTIGEVAARLGVQIRHIRRLVHEERIPYIKWGRLLRFDPAEIERWIDGYRHNGSAAQP